MYHTYWVKKWGGGIGGRRLKQKLHCTATLPALPGASKGGAGVKGHDWTGWLAACSNPPSLCDQHRRVNSFHPPFAHSPAARARPRERERRGTRLPAGLACLAGLHSNLPPLHYRPQASSSARPPPPTLTMEAPRIGTDPNQFQMPLRPSSVPFQVPRQGPPTSPQPSFRPLLWLGSIGRACISLLSLYTSAVARLLALPSLSAASQSTHPTA